MKKTRIILAVLMLTVFSFATQAQSNQTTNVGQALAGLVTVGVGSVGINVGDVTVQDLVDVSDVLNNNQIDILRNAIQNNPIASNNQNVLNNLLRNAKLITGNQIVVGVLSGGILLIDEL